LFHPGVRRSARIAAQPSAPAATVEDGNGRRRPPERRDLRPPAAVPRLPHK